jgi:hypothetical protein
MRKLRVDEIDFRVGTIGKSANGAYCTLLAYKDARVDMSMLDEVFGRDLWQNEYKRDSKGVLQCGIGIYNKDINQWIWKWSNGTESNTEKEKGEYSDALKRAGFVVGIGRELYDVPTLFVNLTKDEFFEKDGKVRQTSKFKPNEWSWEITDQHVKASDSTGQRVFAKFGRGVQTAPPQKQTAPPKPTVAKSAPVPKGERVIVSKGDDIYNAIVKALSNDKGTLEQAVEKYNISEDVQKWIKAEVILAKESFEKA